MLKYITIAEFAEFVSNSHQIKPIIIKIDGRGGSGKSTIAHKLANALNNTLYINLDDYVKNRKDLFSAESINNNFPDQYENTEYDQKVINSLISNTKFKYVIIDGCFGFKKLPDIKANYAIWIDIPRASAAERLNLREREDVARKDITTETIELATEKWQQSEDRYISEYTPREKADFVINN